MAPEHLLASALATAGSLLDELERPADSKPGLHVTGRVARALVWDGCEIARRAAHLAGPYGVTRDARLLVDELRTCPRPGLALDDLDRAEAWDAGVELVIRGLEALDGLAHPGSVRPTEGAEQSGGAR